MVTRCDGACTPVFVIRPREEAESSSQSSTEGKPVPGTDFVFDIHGGGFFLKASPMHFARAKDYAHLLGCPVVMPDYRLLPKHPFPAALEDCLAAYRWALDELTTLQPETRGLGSHNAGEVSNPDGGNIVMLGDSAGGVLAVALTLLASSSGLRAPDSLMLIYPCLDRRCNTSSMEDYVDTPVWDATLNALMWQSYLPDGIPSELASEDAKCLGVASCLNQPMEGKMLLGLASPAESHNLGRLPRTYIEVATFDCLRDEGLALAEELEVLGVPVECCQVPDSPHGYDTVMDSPVVEKMMQKRLEWLTCPR